MNDHNGRAGPGARTTVLDPVPRFGRDRSRRPATMAGRPSQAPGTGTPRIVLRSAPLGTTR